MTTKDKYRFRAGSNACQLANEIDGLDVPAHLRPPLRGFGCNVAQCACKGRPIFHFDAIDLLGEKPPRDEALAERGASP